MREVADIHGELLTMKARTEHFQNRLKELATELANLNYQGE